MSFLTISAMVIAISTEIEITIAENQFDWIEESKSAEVADYAQSLGFEV